MTSFDLSIFANCDIRSIAYILRCMPNLIHFKFLHATRRVASQTAQDLVNGYTWQQMFEMHVPFLSKFDFHISIVRNLLRSESIDYETCLFWMRRITTESCIKEQREECENR
jgi:hypothetical protein